MNTNSFHDAVLLTAGSVAALYGTCFISRYLEGRWVGRVIAQCGRDSFYIMGLHFLAFKLGTLALAMFGLEKPLAQLTAPASGSFLLFLYYTLVGVALPVGAVWAVKCINKLLSSRNA